MNDNRFSDTSHGRYARGDDCLNSEDDTKWRYIVVYTVYSSKKIPEKADTTIWNADLILLRMRAESSDIIIGI